MKDGGSAFPILDARSDGYNPLHLECVANGIRERAEKAYRYADALIAVYEKEHEVKE